MAPRVFTLGKAGLNLTASPIHVADDELLIAQNVSTVGLQLEDGVRKRDGLARLLADALAGRVLAVQNIPYPSEESEPPVGGDPTGLWLFEQSQWLWTYTTANGWVYTGDPTFLDGGGNGYERSFEVIRPFYGGRAVLNRFDQVHLVEQDGTVAQFYPFEEFDEWGDPVLGGYASYAWRMRTPVVVGDQLYILCASLDTDDDGKYHAALLHVDLTTNVLTDWSATWAELHHLPYYCFAHWNGKLWVTPFEPGGSTDVVLLTHSTAQNAPFVEKSIDTTGPGNYTGFQMGAGLLEERGNDLYVGRLTTRTIAVGPSRLYRIDPDENVTVVREASGYFTNSGFIIPLWANEDTILIVEGRTSATTESGSYNTVDCEILVSHNRGGSWTSLATQSLTLNPYVASHAYRWKAGALWNGKVRFFGPKTKTQILTYEYDPDDDSLVEGDVLFDNIATNQFYVHGTLAYRP
jgi:hypothetical protein